MDEEKSLEFRLRNETGEIRVVPRGARWEIGPVFDESTSWSGDEPAGLLRRSGPAYAGHVERDPELMTELERAAAAQALLTVQQPATPAPNEGWLEVDAWTSGVSFATDPRKRYRESRLEPGQTVTILGQAWPWGDVRDGVLTWNPSLNVEADMAGDIAHARETGTLAASAAEAWGNAAIPGFGIGAPTAQPELDPRAHQPEAPRGTLHEEALERYDIPDEELVLSRGQKGGMAVYAGSPQAATSHHDMAFMLGIVGAVMAALCAFALGAIVTGTL